MTTATLPTVEEVVQIPASCTVVAGPEWEDGNGHVNVSHFYGLHLSAAEESLRLIGVDEDYRTSRRLSVFSMEQHLRFLHEVHIGEELSAHVRWLDRGTRSSTPSRSSSATRPVASPTRSRCSRATSTSSPGGPPPSRLTSRSGSTSGSPRTAPCPGRCRCRAPWACAADRPGHDDEGAAPTRVRLLRRAGGQELKRPMDSATRIGLSIPSASTVSVVTTLTAPGAVSSTEVSVARSRMRESTGRGWMKRTLS